MIRPGFLWLALAALPAQAQTRYRLTFPEAAQHCIQIEARFGTGGEAQLDLFMPVWTPGDYTIRDFSKRVDQLSALGMDSRPLPLQTLSKNRWRVICAGQSEVVLRYRVKSAEGPFISGNHVSSEQAVLQGAATFISPVKPVQPAFELRVELPKGWKSIETGLPRAGPAEYRARDFDQLVDCPIVAGSPQVDEFQVAGVRHRLVYLSRPADSWDRARATRDAARMVEVTHKLWGFFPFAQDPPRGYWFFNLPARFLGGAGLEHKNSTCIEYYGGSQKNLAGYRKWLETASHEYFHTWNGKNLRPVALGPFDYEARNETPSLWIAEGLTHYYEGLLLTRAGLANPSDYLASLSSYIGGFQRTRGIDISLSEASLRTWEPYQRVSYRSGGVAVGFLLDQQIRQATSGRASLDEVMRQAYHQYSGESGYTEEQFEAVASQVSGVDLGEFFRRALRSSEALDFAPALSYYGLRFQSAPAYSRTWRLEVDPEAPPESRAHWQAYLSP
ncbi:MAG: hypothetical protein U0931_37075 [Vulcanimicrobiota bacterium]